MTGKQQNYADRGHTTYNKFEANKTPSRSSARAAAPPDRPVRDGTVHI